MLMCGKLSVRLRLVSSHGVTVTRKMEVTSVDSEVQHAHCHYNIAE